MGNALGSEPSDGSDKKKGEENQRLLTVKGRGCANIKRGDGREEGASEKSGNSVKGGRISTSSCEHNAKARTFSLEKMMKRHQSFFLGGIRQNPSCSP